MAASFTSLGSRGPISLLRGGAFQFAGKVHHGAILVSASGIYDWKAAETQAGDTELRRFLDEEKSVRGDFLLLGTGAKPQLPPPRLRDEVESLGLGLDVMITSAACRTYNVLLAENRLFCAAFLPV